MLKSKKWCNVCNFMTYGDCHEVEARVPNDVKLDAPGSGLILVTFPETAMPGNSSANITTSPQVGGRPLHLAIDPVIDDIEIGKNSQFATWNGGARAGCFQPQPENKAWWNNLYGMEPWQVGQYITLRVRNINPALRSFSALMRAQAIW